MHNGIRDRKHASSDLADQSLVWDDCRDRCTEHNVFAIHHYCRRSVGAALLDSLCSVEHVPSSKELMTECAFVRSDATIYLRVSHDYGVPPTLPTNQSMPLQVVWSNKSLMTQLADVSTCFALLNLVPHAEDPVARMHYTL